MPRCPECAAVCGHLPVGFQQGRRSLILAGTLHGVDGVSPTREDSLSSQLGVSGRLLLWIPFSGTLLLVAFNLELF